MPLGNHRVEPRHEEQELLSPGDLAGNRPGRALPATTSGSERRRCQPTATRSRGRRADKSRDLPLQQPGIRRRRRGTNRDSLVAGSQGRRNAESHHRRKGAGILKTGQISAERLRRRAN